MAAPVGNGELDKLTGTALALTVNLVAPDCQQGPLPLLRDGVLASIEDRLELPVVCKADVLAPVGNGKLTALTGWVVCQKYH